ncbi:trypsin-like serine peptidase [Streptomyces scopuliridis]|uniref:trypsin-like serine peptidase n=1 Tax=Streptomyces scopuliridis TaxID=452529 RepID=UPI003684E9C1
MNRSSARRASRLCVLAVTAAALCAGALAPTAAAQDTAARELGVAVSQETSTRAERLAFWTPERMREAIDNPLTGPESAPGSVASPTRPTGTPGEAEQKVVASAPATAPASAPPSTSGSTPPSVAGAAAADIAISQRVPLTTTYPMNLVGKLFSYDDQGNEAGTCSASVITTQTKSTIWTAAHCVHRGDKSGDAGFYKDLMFIPAYSNGASPWGIWMATTKYAPVGYTEESDNLESDFAAVELAPEPDYGKIQDAMGAFGYSFGSADHADAVTAGYPGEGYQRTDLDGEYMMACYGNAEDYANFNPFDNRIKMDCDMGKGASGGPMLIASEASGIQIIGANSHYLADSSTKERINDDLLSSEHGVRAANVIDAVNSGS